MYAFRWGGQCCDLGDSGGVIYAVWSSCGDVWPSPQSSAGLCFALSLERQECQTVWDENTTKILDDTDLPIFMHTA